MKGPEYFCDRKGWLQKISGAFHVYIQTRFRIFHVVDFYCHADSLT